MARQGWIPARAFPIEKGLTSGVDDPEGGDPVINTSLQLDVTWEVEVSDGRPRYQFSETRKAPVWASSSGFSAGNRWYKPRLKPSAGLLAKLGVPCLVHPDDPHKLWVDWDAAYDEHVPVWEQDAAVAREVERRRGGVDGVLARVNPFARKIDASEEQLVEEAIAAEAAEKDAAWAAAEAMNEQALAAQDITEDQKQSWEEVKRLYDVGTPVPAKILSDAPTGTTLGEFPAHEITVEFELDGQTRFASFRYARNPVTARRLKVGKTCTLRVDPDDPTNVAPEI